MVKYLLAVSALLLGFSTAVLACPAGDEAKEKNSESTQENK